MRSISTKPFAVIAAAAALTLAGATAQAAPVGPRSAQGLANAAESGSAPLVRVQHQINPYYHQPGSGYRGNYRGYRGGYHGGYRGGRYYRHRHHHNDAGAAIAGGILGLAAGAIIAGSVAQNSNTVQYCMNRYRSYDPRSGTYLGYDGLRHPCP